MSDSSPLDDAERLVERLRQLPSKQVREVLDFIDFLEFRERQREWVSFDEWALNIAKVRGFSHLNEEEVAQIVMTHRHRS